MFSKDQGVQTRLLDFIENSLDAYAIFNSDDTLEYCNPAFGEIFGVKREDMLGSTFEDLAKNSYETHQGIHIEAEDLEGWLQYVQTVRRQQDFRLFEVDLTDGRWFLFSEQLNDAGELLVHAKNITKQKQLADRIQGSNEKLRHLALTDELTGIPNRRHFLDAAQAELNRCWRSGKQAALLLLDLDHFRKLNDDHGHPAGDAGLQHMAHLIKETLREYDIFGRIGGEEFAIFLGQDDAQLAPQIAERIRQLVETNPIPFENQQISMTVSVGLTLQPSDTPYEQLFDQADKALYAAKSKGRNRIEIYTRESG